MIHKRCQIKCLQPNIHIYNGEWWLSGKFDALGPEGPRFKSHSSRRHIANERPFTHTQCHTPTHTTRIHTHTYVHTHTHMHTHTHTHTLYFRHYFVAQFLHHHPPPFVLIKINYLLFRR